MGLVYICREFTVYTLFLFDIEKCAEHICKNLLARTAGHFYFRIFRKVFHPVFEQCQPAVFRTRLRRTMCDFNYVPLSAPQIRV